MWDKFPFDITQQLIEEILKRESHVGPLPRVSTYNNLSLEFRYPMVDPMHPSALQVLNPPMPPKAKMQSLQGKPFDRYIWKFHSYGLP
jgi:hypothetical protein